MDITLEKIELVKDRTGVSYKEAKDALVQTDGNVVDAIILIEEGIDVAPRNQAETAASKIVEDLKVLVSKGNVTKILVKRDDQVVLNIPVNVGILGVVLVPWAAIIAAVAALGLHCNISIVKSDGEVVDVVEKATSKFGSMKDNYSSVADDLKEKGSEAVSKVKEKAGNVKSKVGSVDLFEDDDDLFDLNDNASDVEVTKSAAEAAESVMEKAEDAVGSVKANAENAAESFMDKAGEIKDAVEEKIDDLKDTVSDLFEKDTIEDSFEDAISEFKSRVSEAADSAERHVDAIIDELINDDADLYDAAENKHSELEDLLAEAEKAGAEAEDALQGARDAIEDAVDAGEEKFESTINDLQEKKKRFRFFS